MKNIVFDSHLLAAYLNFCELCDLKVVSQTIAGTMQGAYCDLMVASDKYQDSIRTAEDKYILYNGKLITIYGAFENVDWGIENLKSAKEQHGENKKETIKFISELKPNTP